MLVRPRLGRSKGVGATAVGQKCDGFPPFQITDNRFVALIAPPLSHYRYLIPPSMKINSVPIGIATGLAFEKIIGILGAVLVLVKTGIVPLPAGASRLLMIGTILRCGIGFTMSLLISLLAFTDQELQNEAKAGNIFGSVVAGAVRFLVLRFAARAVLNARHFSANFQHR